MFRQMQNKIFPAVTAWAGLYKSEHLSWKVCDTPPCHHLQLEIGIRAGSQAGTSGDASDDTLSIVLTPRVGLDQESQEQDTRGWLTLSHQDGAPFPLS